MTQGSVSKFNLPRLGFLILTGVVGWWVPGAGHWLIGERKRAVIIFFSLMFTFGFGLYIGSIATIDAPDPWHIVKVIYSLAAHKPPASSMGGSPWYWAQIFFSPGVGYIAHLSVALHLDSFGKPREIGEIYTGVAGLLNLLCVVNAVYMAHRISAGGLKE